MSIERVGHSHPDVCQQGGCAYRRLEGANYCQMHSGSIAALATQRNATRTYQLTAILGDKYSRMAASGGRLKDLTEEITILRATLETVINRLKTDDEVALFADKISGLATNIGKLVEGTQRLEERNKELIDRQTLFEITDDIIKIIFQHVTDADAMANIAECVFETVMKRFPDGQAQLALQASGS